jgi:hypothetical protein
MQAARSVEEACASPTLETIQLALLLQEGGLPSPEIDLPSGEGGATSPKGGSTEDASQQRHAAWFRGFCHGCCSGEEARKGLFDAAKGAELLAEALTETLPVARLPALATYKTVLQGRPEGVLSRLHLSSSDTNTI